MITPLRSQPANWAPWALAAAIALASFALRAPFQIQALGAAGHDDLLFVRLADSLRSGEWLGEYDDLTLAKGAGYSIFMAVTSLLHIPLKVAEHGVYLAASLGFSVATGRLVRSRACALVCFGVLAFNPVFWVADIGGRVVRENLYVSLGLALVAFAIHALLIGSPGAPDAEARRNRWSLVGLGAVGALFWITREEGVWLVPALAVIVLAWLWRHRHPAAAGAVRHAGRLVVYLALPVVVFGVLVGVVNAINFARYGLFINNDFRARNFPAAYGALARIEHERWRPYVIFPADARRKAYAVSPAARELAPLFEGERGEFWRRVGCDQTRTPDCTEILSGWFMWALREAIHTAGHDTAHAARALERRLAREINTACEQGKIACGPRNSSVVPSWRPEYLPRVLEATRSVAGTLLTLGGVRPDVKPSSGSEDQLSRFQRVTRGPLAREVGPRPEATLTNFLSRMQAAALPILLPAAMVAWIILAAISATRRQWHQGHVVIAALMLAIAMRVVLLGFLEATSIPSDNMLYLAPVTPMALAMAPCVLFLALDMLRNQRRWLVSPAGSYPR